ncbi:peptidase M15 [Amycolatopsis suaedae]|uniref:Peptidase M15 n=1 Tax=Amycolatopsis suaedae TaxID=2510978 RepID=A0A4V2ELV7_9PSEU|nr:peptidase M15 [Amycolatopsis suaedae]
MIAALLAVLAPQAGAQRRDDDKPRSQGSCANRELPPPPVDTSEKPKPGQASPAPLPVPGRAVGGERMAECGLILPRNTRNPPAQVTAASWVLHDLDTGAVIAARDPHGRQRPASLIKTLLALVVIKELQPGTAITVTKEDAEQECTCVGIVAGGQYTVEQLLYGLLMHSGNDVAHALATALGGVPATLEKMNALATSIGATDTRAATPSGLDGPGMSSSAYDMSLIFHAAMKQPLFAKAVATRQIQFPGWGEKQPFPLYNDNKLLSSYPGFLGGKTGFTDDARHTYVGAAQQGGRRLAVVMMRGEQKPIRFSDQAAKLLDYGFALAAANPEPVGKVDYDAGATEPTADVAGKSPVAAAASTAEDPFGVTGWIITMFVGVIIIVGFVVGHRRKRAAEDPHQGL